MPSNIKNYYERLVMECIQDTLGESEEAADGDFVEDLACLTLNALPPRYVRHTVDLSSHLGDADREAMNQEVMRAVDNALTTIRRREARGER
ncbi:late competence development ComFB family protein [Thiocystis violacea]|uniref:late competence development ComFB family protein n=1 Tax=Thiocystis violacea TaxID=13725 RepID=UPI0019046E99|nr:late competence development ComFB family protein [Thiocystis violacea]MBK1716697.1 competence protein ComFB [Thiocystis violacea]